jgi:hypothetical protein
MRQIFQVFLLAFSMTVSGQPAGNQKLITAHAAGPVKLGMTVAQVRQAVKPMTLSRTSDGEGIALVAVSLSKKQAPAKSDDERMVMTLYAGEEDPDAPVDEKAKIKMAEVWDKSFKTSRGVHVGMLLRDVEKLYGKVKRIVISEIESREYATFTNQPAGITFRVSYDAGKYEPGKQSTTRYNPGACVYSIIISKN